MKHVGFWTNTDGAFIKLIGAILLERSLSESSGYSQGFASTLSSIVTRDSPSRLGCLFQFEDMGVDCYSVVIRRSLSSR